MDTLLSPPPAPALKAESALAPARLLHYSAGHSVALPVHTTIELLDSAVTVEVPGAAHYCQQLVSWRGQWLALLDLEALLRTGTTAVATATAAAVAPRYVLVVAYQCAPRSPLEYGAIGLPALPQTVSVSDQMACPLPADSTLWPQLALSCFAHEERAVPILDSARLFAAYIG
ncbi:MAG: chemotaxis protein CheW [Polaromonas sp.]|nr:chemotaxis protein CheW [Polaromonas sp.]